MSLEWDMLLKDNGISFVYTAKVVVRLVLVNCEKKGLCYVNISCIGAVNNLQVNMSRGKLQLG